MSCVAELCLDWVVIIVVPLLTDSFGAIRVIPSRICKNIPPRTVVALKGRKVQDSGSVRSSILLSAKKLL